MFGQFQGLHVPKYNTLLNLQAGRHQTWQAHRIFSRAKPPSLPTNCLDPSSFPPSPLDKVSHRQSQRNTITSQNRESPSHEPNAINSHRIRRDIRPQRRLQRLFTLVISATSYRVRVSNQLTLVAPFSCASEFFSASDPGPRVKQPPVTLHPLSTMAEYTSSKAKANARYVSRTVSLWVTSVMAGEMLSSETVPLIWPERVDMPARSC